MGYFTVINKLLDLKIVQWGMLACIACGLVMGGVYSIKYNGLRLQYAVLKATNSDLFAGIQIQNGAIKRLGEEAKLKEETLKQARVRAEQVAVATKKEITNLKKFNFKKGASCNEKVKAVFSIISSSR